MEGELEDFGEKCGVGAVKLFGPIEEFPSGGAFFYCIEITEDQQNRGALSSGIASVNQPMLGAGGSPAIKTKKGKGTSYSLFGKPGDVQHIQNCVNYRGDTAIAHNRYDTSTRNNGKKGIPLTLDERVEQILALLSQIHEDKAVIEQIATQLSELSDERLTNLMEEQTIKLQAHPFVRKHGKLHKSFAFAFNGNITNSQRLKEELGRNGEYHFETNTDTEIIKILIERELSAYDSSLNVDDFRTVFGNLRSKLQGAYTLTYLDGKGNMVFMTDPGKYRPAVYGIKKRGEEPRMVCYSSETSALNRIGLSDSEIYELEPDSIIISTNEGVKGPFVLTPKDEPRKRNHCIFELVYFSKAISRVFGIDVHLARRFLGRELARIDAEKGELSPLTFVAPIPSTPIPIMEGYVDELRNIGLKKLIEYMRSADRNSNEFENEVARIYLEHNVLPYDLLIKYSDVRTFMSKNIAKISDLIGRKHFVSDILGDIPVDSMIELLYQNDPEKLKRVKVFEDSVVRGNTIIKNLSQIAKHGKVDKMDLLVGSAPVRYPCYDGIDMPTLRELIAAGRSPEGIIMQINSKIGVPILGSLTYLPVDSMKAAVIDTGRIFRVEYQPCDFCSACFDGEYRDEGAKSLFELESESV